VNRIKTAGTEYNLLINTSKTKVMSLDGKKATITVDGIELEQVNKFPYLGALISDDATCSADIRQRIALGNAVLAGLKSLWRSHALSLSTKLKLCKTLAWPVTTYGCESWTLRQTEIKKLEAYEMKMIRKVLRIPRTAQRTNESVLQEAGYHRQFLGTIKQRKLKYLGHVMRKEGENLEKTVIQGSVPGKRERGRPKKAWLDDATEWTGMGLQEMLKMIGQRMKWKKIIQNAANP